jgi:hypothetical protein
MSKSTRAGLVDPFFSQGRHHAFISKLQGHGNAITKACFGEDLMHPQLIVIQQLGEVPSCSSIVIYQGEKRVAAGRRVKDASALDRKLI